MTEPETVQSPQIPQHPPGNESSAPPSRPGRNHGILASPLVGVPLMVILEIYARLRGVYRTSPIPHLHDYPFTHWPPTIHTNRPIVAFGDSMTEGIGAHKNQAYPEQLARLTALPVINAGRSGDTSADGLQRFASQVLPHNPGLILLCLGGNDLIQRIHVHQTFENLSQIISIAHDAQVPVVILGLRGSWLLKIDHDTPTRQLARRTGCPLLPLILDDIWGIPWLMAEHVHPNHRGYKKLAHKVAHLLNQLGICPAA